MLLCHTRWTERSCCCWQLRVVALHATLTSVAHQELMLCTVFGFCSRKINFIANCFVRHKMPLNGRQVPRSYSPFIVAVAVAALVFMAALLAVAQLDSAAGGQTGRHIKEQFGRHSLQLVRHLYFAIQNYVGIQPSPPAHTPPTTLHFAQSQ